MDFKRALTQHKNKKPSNTKKGDERRATSSRQEKPVANCNFLMAVCFAQNFVRLKLKRMKNGTWLYHRDSSTVKLLNVKRSRHVNLWDGHAYQGRKTEIASDRPLLQFKECNCFALYLLHFYRLLFSFL